MSDALATLRNALSPKTGMRRIPFPLESYEHPSLPLSAKRLINLMAEQQPADARTAAALVSTPTLQVWDSAVGGSGAISAGPTAAVVVVAPRAYTCGHDVGDPLNLITDPDFPGATSVAYCDGYFCF